MAISHSSLSGAARGRPGSLRLLFGLTATSLALAGIVALAAALRFANIDAIGQSNTYYTAAVESMLKSWHNFFFVAAEPGGSVSVDKPPVGLWVQAISAYFLGVNGFAVVLPQILAGIASVVVLFQLVRRSFGNAAGLLAALVLAVTPVAIAVERNNTPDATLILTLLLAAWAFIVATERRQLRWLVVGAVLVGVGFNIKMMQALLPLPALYALYYFGARGRWWTKALHLVLATLVLVPVSLSWAIAVDLTPAEQRPYVGGSDNNSALNLIVGYNGIERLVGNMPGGGTRAATNVADDADAVTGGATATSEPSGASAATQAAPPDGGTRPDGANRPGGGAGGGGMFGTGEAGPLRLFQSGLASQVSWLLPFGLLGMLPLAIGAGRRKPQTDLHRGLILWGGWLLTCAVFFSVAGFFHQYYLAMLAPPLAALVAIGLVYLWQLHATHPGRAALLLLGIAGTTLAYQVYAVALYEALDWWIGLPLALGVAGFGLLLPTLRRKRPLPARAAFGLLAAALLAVPAAWSGLTVTSSNSNLPTAYTGAIERGGMGGPPNAASQTAGSQTGATPGGMDGGVSDELLAYLEAYTQDTEYLVVVPSSQAGAELVLATGRPVLYAGGFGGGDPVIDAEDLAGLAAAGDVRYVLWGGDGRNGDSSSGIAAYLEANAAVVGEAATTGGRGGQLTLYQLEE